MDSQSMSYTPASVRSSSRIYQDLATCRSSSSSSEDRLSPRMDVSTKDRIRSSSELPKVCIVGAGISGLRCADVLLQHGFHVTILEGRDRIGGRMHQITLPSGFLVDVGPNWIHGTENNPIMDLAEKTSTPTHTWRERANIFGEDGKILQNAQSLNDVLWSIIGAAFRYSAKNYESINAEESLLDFFEQKVQERFIDETNADERRKIVMQMAELWGAFVGSPTSKQSLKFFWLEECIDGENLFCAGTYQKILSKIAKPALQAADVKLSTRVTRIENIENKVIVATTGGDRYAFDEVVVTAPLGWIQKNKDAVFAPSLPVRLSQAIDSIGYGSLEKVYITFPRAFWLSSKADQIMERFTGFIQWLAPSYAGDTNPYRWNQEAIDLSTLPESCKHPTLLYYIYGEQSISLAAQLSTLPSESARDAHLKTFFQSYYALMPNYDGENEDCKPVSCYATSWVTDELAGYGSYSTFRTGLKDGDKDVEVMREGLPDRSIWIAGEHVAPFVALGTVTGAYWSGESVGKRIAEAYGKEANEAGTDVEQNVNNGGL